MKARRRCTAMLSDRSRRCKNAAILGGRVCRVHGGSAPQVKRSARQRLMELAEPAVEALRMALESEDIRAIVRAAIAVLDRTGHHPRQRVEVEDATTAPLNFTLKLDKPEQRSEERTIDVRQLSTDTLRRIHYEVEHGEPYPDEQVRFYLPEQKPVKGAAPTGTVALEVQG